MHVFPVRFMSEEFSASVLVTQFTGAHTIESFLEDIYNGYSSERLAASALIVRPNVNDQFSNDELLSAMRGTPKADSQFLTALSDAYANKNDTFARFDSLPIFVLHNADFQIAISDNINPLVAAPAELDAAVKDPHAPENIRDAEFRHLVKVSMALLPPVENSFYKNPSQRAAKSWLRAGNVQFSRLSIDAVTFWLLPHLKECEAILVDTWSLSSIAFNASRVLSRLRGIPPIPVEMLSQYQDYSEARQAALLETLNRLHSEGVVGRTEDGDLNVTCIVSVTHTGSLVDVVSRQAELSGLALALKFVAIFQIGKNEFLPSLCDLSADHEFESVSDSDAANKPFITIDERVYFPVSYVDIEHMAMKAQADHFRDFIDMVMGKDVISVHRDQTSDAHNRHHAIHVDTKNLFALERFKSKFQEELLSLSPPPTLIITPPHEAAELMGEYACDVLQASTSTRPRLIAHSNLLLNAGGVLSGRDDEIKAELQKVSEDEAILILDDCFITGARITGYQTRLRHLNLKPRIHYMVGLSRPDDLKNWNVFCKRLTFRPLEDRTVFGKNTITAVFTVVFPNWQEERCPWCEEGLRYQKLRFQGKPVPDFLGEREILLANRNTGLRDNLFLDPGIHDIKLYSGSIFASEGSNQAETFAAIAAGIQRLRVDQISDKPLLGPRRHPIVTVLNYADYLRVTFSDTVIRASFLRAASREELVYSNVGKEADRTNALYELMTSPDTDKSNGTLEYILASALDKCTINANMVNLSAIPGANELMAFVAKQ